MPRVFVYTVDDLCRSTFTYFCTRNIINTNEVFEISQIYINMKFDEINQKAYARV